MFSQQVSPPNYQESKQKSLQKHVSEPFTDNISDKNANSTSSGERIISRRVISLPFEPIPHCICFTRDSKYVFVAMYSSVNILNELKEEQEAQYGDRAQMDEEERTKWPDHPVSLCCVNIHSQRIVECERIWKYFRDDEHVSCMAISPNGARIAIGTSLGQLIVTGVPNLTGDIGKDNEEDFSPMVSKLWSSESMRRGLSALNQNGGIGNSPEDDDDDDDLDGSVTAINWSPDSNWIVCGMVSGTIAFWKEQAGKQPLFCREYNAESVHIEAINSLSICGALLATGADDGNVVIHDLSLDRKLSVLSRFDKVHGGRMVNSVSLGQLPFRDGQSSYAESLLMTAGADNVVQCIAFRTALPAGEKTVILLSGYIREGNIRSPMEIIFICSQFYGSVWRLETSNSEQQSDEETSGPFLHAPNV